MCDKKRKRITIRLPKRRKALGHLHAGARLRVGNGYHEWLG